MTILTIPKNTLSPQKYTQKNYKVNKKVLYGGCVFLLFGITSYNNLHMIVSEDSLTVPVDIGDEIFGPVKNLYTVKE